MDGWMGPDGRVVVVVRAAAEHTTRQAARRWAERAACAWRPVLPLPVIALA
jgi:hypothetical protein